MAEERRSKPSFFKVLFNEDFTLQLRLPTAFVQKHGDILHENVVLGASSGESWVVKLEHIEEYEKCYFTRGWPKVAKDLGLKMGEFLVFWLVGKSRFDVLVYGISGCERVISNCNSEFESSDSDEEVQILSKDYTFAARGNPDTSNKRAKTSILEKEATRSPVSPYEVCEHVWFDQPKDTGAGTLVRTNYDSLERNAGKNQLVAITEGVESDSDYSVVFLKEILAGKSVGRKNQDVDDIDEYSGGTELQVQQRTRDGNNRFEAYTRASVFMSKKPIKSLFSIVVMHPSYVSNRRSALHLSPAFSNAILPDKANSSILLVSQGKTWPVRYIRGERRASLTSGWRKFTIDNDLKKGDACVFEVSNRINLTWNVIIFRT